jgi:hypothetical protein
VQWNGIEKTFDCPCHGSHFDKEGRLIQGERAVQEVGLLLGFAQALSCWLRFAAGMADALCLGFPTLQAQPRLT